MAATKGGVMRRVRGWLFMLVLGVILGLGSVFAVVRSSHLLNTVTSGPWQTNLLTGSAEADFYTRAVIAVNAVLALSREETIYFMAREDSAGQPLRAECRYRLAGPAPAARWWSVTAYAADNFLMPVAQKRYSVSGEDVVPDAGGQVAFTLGPQEALGAPHIPTTGTGAMVLTLRLYNPAPLVVAAPKRFAAPTITREGEC